MQLAPPILAARAADRFGAGALMGGFWPVSLATNGCFVDAKPERGRSARRAALETLDGRVWVGFSRSPSAEAAVHGQVSAVRATSDDGVAYIPLPALV